jgi:hypothetical protein
MAKLMEYNFNNWIIPPNPNPAAVPNPPYYPDLSGNNYHLNDSYGNSLQAGDGPAGDAAGNCINAVNLNTYFGANSTIGDSNFDWGLTGSFSVFWCMRIMQISGFSEIYPIVTNFANTYPFWNVFIELSGTQTENASRLSLAYEEVGPRGVALEAKSQLLTPNYGWHTYAVTVNRQNGVASFYLDAVKQNERSWNTTNNVLVQSEQHEITFFGSNLIADYGHLSSAPPVNLRFDGTEFYDNILSLSDIQTLHAKYT